MCSLCEASSAALVNCSERWWMIIQAAPSFVSDLSQLGQNCLTITANQIVTLMFNIAPMKNTFPKQSVEDVPSSYSKQLVLLKIFFLNEVNILPLNTIFNSVFSANHFISAVVCVAEVFGILEKYSLTLTPQSSNGMGQSLLLLQLWMLILIFRSAECTIKLKCIIYPSQFSGDDS
ncbi:hypothetical protein T4C_3075 [Trichinella pseudospiralis]|uniref:Uncharacterized protein n=1 Tax=Trichinella pseudospiralis TaxID=6337 RepID=A0A0V1JJR0_TRIPS|nr:hypothetical protein T4C_3075 [Trichinella pseudospiralis]